MSSFLSLTTEQEQDEHFSRRDEDDDMVCWMVVMVVGWMVVMVVGWMVVMVVGWMFEIRKKNSEKKAEKMVWQKFFFCPNVDGEVGHDRL